MGRASEDRRARLRINQGPGPAYMLPPTVGYVGHDETRHRNPAYSFGLQLHSSLVKKDNGPGPIYLIPKGMTAKGPEGQPAFSIKRRTPLKGAGTDTPGPAAYYPDINVNRAKPPAFGIASRTPIIDKGKFSPGPIYKLPSCLGPHVPDKTAAQGVSIKGKGRNVEVVSQSPGPIYDIGSPKLIKSSAGEVSIKGRWKSTTPRGCCAAGPASYNVSDSVPKVYRQAPAFSLGIRHSEFAGNYLTAADKSGTVGAGDVC